MIEQYPAIELFLTMVVQVIVPPLPAELIVVTAGKVYGTAFTTVWGGAGLFTGSLTVYCIGRVIQQKLARFFRRKKVEKVIKRIRRLESTILWVRILPYNPSDLISYAAGIVQVNPLKFLIITFFTSFIRVFLLARLGSYISDLKTLIYVAVLLLLSALAGGFMAYGREKDSRP